MINLDLYPITDLSTPEAKTLLASCREGLASTGICILERFVQTPSLQAMRDDATLTPTTPLP